MLKKTIAANLQTIFKRARNKLYLITYGKCLKSCAGLPFFWYCKIEARAALIFRFKPNFTSQKRDKMLAKKLANSCSGVHIHFRFIEFTESLKDLIKVFFAYANACIFN